MSRILGIVVTFHEGRYHGVEDWPPSPGRLFQALLSGVARGGRIASEHATLLGRLEELAPPSIMAPAHQMGCAVRQFVPNNDLDAKIRKDVTLTDAVASIRTAKDGTPLLFDAADPVVYLWELPETFDAEALATVARDLYCLGRGSDAAWARVEVRDSLNCWTASFRGDLYVPSERGGATPLNCPKRGTLQSLIDRHSAQCNQFSSFKVGRTTRTAFKRPPKARFARVGYATPDVRLGYELRHPDDETLFNAWPIAGVAELTGAIRDCAVERLLGVLPEQRETILREIAGRGATDADKRARIHITPLPSIGHEHADRGIRRVLVSIPARCSLAIEDIQWALSTLDVVNQATGEIACTLLESHDQSMWRHFGVQADKSRFKLWRSVTPVVVPGDKTGKRRETGISERDVRGLATKGVVTALSHARIRHRPSAIRLQKEPFSRAGQPAERFVTGTRFRSNRLWHVELEFEKGVTGPLLVGDGRYLGLGLFEPVRREPCVLRSVCDTALESPEDAARALRRAVMSCVDRTIDSKDLPPYFTGHESSGQPLRSGTHRHLAFAYDPIERALLVIPPNVIEGRSAESDETRHFDQLVRVLDRLGKLSVRGHKPVTLGAFRAAPDSHTTAAARDWESITTYSVTRHTRRATTADALIRDVQLEHTRRGWPIPTVRVLEASRGVRGDVQGRLHLSYDTARLGPIAIGRSCHLGGGLFGAVG